MTNINTFQGDVFIHEYIKHSGDDNNLFGFSGTDTFKIATGGTDRLTVSSNGSVTLGVNLVIPDYIVHSGDENTKFGFSAADTFIIDTAGTNRLTVSSSGNVTVGVDMNIPDYIYHTGNGTTKFGFSGADTFKIATGGTDRLVVGSDGNVTMTNAIIIPDYIYHTGDLNNLFGFSGTDTFKIATAGTDRLTVQSNGNVGIGTATSDNRVHIYNNVDNVGYVMENNARTFTMGIRGDTSDVFAITDDTAGEFRMTITTAGVVKFFGDVYFNQAFGLGAVSGSYGSVQTKGTGAGSYEGYNINAQWVFMSNGAASCGIYNDTDTEWATKWNQNGSTDLYYNGVNKFQTTNDGAHVSGALYADHMYIDDYLYHTGDTNTRIGFGSNDTIYMRTNGSDRLIIDSSGRVRMPNVPAFVAHRNGGNFVNSELTAIPFNATDANNGSHYSTGNYRFTAPVNGHYAFHAQGLHRKINGNGTVEPTFYQNNGNTSNRGQGFSHMVNTAEQVTTIHIVRYMNAGQYMTHGVHLINSVTDYYYGERLGTYSGYLLG